LESFAAGQQNNGRPGRSNSPSQGTADSLGVRVTAPNDNLLQRFGLDAGTKGAIITGVSRGSLAAQAGLRVGDVITRIDNVPVESPTDVSDILAKKDLSTGVTLIVTSRESTRSVFIKSSSEK
jgi:S1-C subfamily serine protease